MPHPYETFFEQYDASKKKKMSPCDRLNELNTTIVKVEQDRVNYYRLNLKGYWCLFKKHKDIIDDNIEKIKLERPVLEEQCKDYRSIETTLFECQKLIKQNQAVAEQCTDRMSQLMGSNR